MTESSERDVQREVGSGVGRNLAAHAARADEACLVAAVAGCETDVLHREADSCVVVVELAAAVVPHVACEHAPVWCEVDLEQAGHPVALAFLGGQVLEFETARKFRGPLVEQVSDDDVGQTDVAARHLAVLVIFLRRVQNLVQMILDVNCSYIWKLRLFDS